MDMQIFKSLGLSEAEARVYTALLEIGLSTTGQIIRQTDLQKSTVYYSLDHLEKTGFVRASLRNNVKYFKAENPKIIIEKIRLLEQEAEKTIKELRIIQKPREEKINSMVNEGFKAVVSSLQHRLTVLKKGDEILIFGSLAANPEEKGAVLAIKKINREVIKRGIRIKIIFNKKLKNSTLAKFYEKLSNIKIKYTNDNIPVGIALYKEFVYTLVWTDPRNPTSVLIQSKIIARMYTDFFEDIWQRN